MWEAPRVTKPYTDEQWLAIETLGRRIDVDVLDKVASRLAEARRIDCYSVGFASTFQSQLHGIAIAQRAVASTPGASGRLQSRLSALALHVIEDVPLMREMAAASSRMNTDLSFLRALHARGRRQADAWLAATRTDPSRASASDTALQRFLRAVWRWKLPMLCRTRSLNSFTFMFRWRTAAIEDAACASCSPTHTALCQAFLHQACIAPVSLRYRRCNSGPVGADAG